MNYSVESLSQATTLDARLRWSLTGGGVLREVSLIEIRLRRNQLGFWLGGRLRDVVAYERWPLMEVPLYLL